MLTGKLPVDDYLSPFDLEYPAFSRDMCHLLRRLKAQGKEVYQIEPFLEALMSIHDFFADGHGPEDLEKNTLAYPVYLSEKNAIGALLDYYRTVMSGTFDQTLESVIRFAREHTARFRLRDSLRAQALAPLVCHYPSAYIEAGMPHLKDELKCIQMVSLLSLNDCRELFQKIRGSSSIEASQFVSRFVQRA